MHLINADQNKRENEFLSQVWTVLESLKQSENWVVVASVFWDVKGTFLIDYIKKGKTITDEYHARLIDQLGKTIRESRTRLQKDHALAHKESLTIGKSRDLRYELLEDPPYLPDLACADIRLFPNENKSLAGRLSIVTLRDGIHLLEKRWRKCIERGLHRKINTF